MTLRLAIAILVLVGMPAFAHRLDEYLQATIISVEKDRVQAQMTLTPGVAVVPMLIPSIDTDANGVISGTEQQAYAERVLQDLSLAIDGQHLKLQLLSVQFPALQEMQEGRGQIQLEFKADLPLGGRKRRITLENRHQSGIAAYLVNVIVPRDPNIRIAAQSRNYSQSSYVLEYEQTDIGPHSASAGFGKESMVWLGLIALFMSIRLVEGIVRRRTIHPNNEQ